MMKQIVHILLIGSIIILLMNDFSSSQDKSFRPPATPLAVCDPYFSIWSFADHPADDWPRHWTGKIQALCNLVRIDGKTFRAVGHYPHNIPSLTMKQFTLTPTRTIYDFEEIGVNITLTFMTPSILYDLKLMSKPITYVIWQVKSIDGKEHNVSIYFDNSGELVVNSADQEITWSRFNIEGIDVLSMGSREQEVLQKSGDDIRIDWGYFYLASPDLQNAKSVISNHEIVRNSFAKDGIIPLEDDLRMPRPAFDNWPVLAYQIDLGKVNRQPTERVIVMAYDDKFSIEYFSRKLRPYWCADGTNIELLLKSAVNDYDRLKFECKNFDEELSRDLKEVGGEMYERTATLAYRQAVAAHKLVTDMDGTPLLFPKENFSNGCISTVDVIYPASPIFLLFNIELVKASITPILQYSSLPRWKFPFAPHDLGTYPKANGQVYGGGELTEENQMPVEESGNMLILAYAISKIDGNTNYVSKYWSVISKWADYLKVKGLDPENQLCTDDFAGHLTHNVNLSLKAILALASFSKLCDMMDKKQEALGCWEIVKEYAKNWEIMASDGDHYRLAFDKSNTWSQKYNLVWDKLLNLNIFSSEISEKEIRYYLKKQNRFGLPLDNRKDYTKLDWIFWTATLADNKKDFEELISPVYRFVNETPDRVPLTDWYDTKTAKQVGFQARPVVGGVFIKMLTDQKIWNKWLRKVP